MKLRACLTAALFATSFVACAEAEQSPVETKPAVTAAAQVNSSSMDTAQQQAFEYEFDTVHTQVLFFVSHLGFSTSQGEFLEFDGGFNFTPDDWSQSNVEVMIDTSSITMNDGKWDDHMKNEDFFNVTKFPKMTFKSTKVESADGKTGKLYGDLTLLDVTKPVVLDVIFNKAAVHPFSKRYVAGFSATGALQRTDFGMKYGAPLIGDEVKIRLEVEGMRKQ